MGQVEELPPPEVAAGSSADDAWAQSLRDVMRDVIAALPDHATLGELIAAAQSNKAMSPVLEIFTVQELIDIAKKRPKMAANGNGAKRARAESDDIPLDEDGNPLLDLQGGPAVIRRRADVPDGDVRLLRCLAEKGPLREADLATVTGMTAEQLRITVRHLRTKGYLHVEGTAHKRRFKITRNGGSFLRKQAS